MRVQRAIGVGVAHEGAVRATPHRATRDGPVSASVRRAHVADAAAERTIEATRAIEVAGAVEAARAAKGARATEATRAGAPEKLCLRLGVAGKQGDDGDAREQVQVLHDPLSCDRDIRGASRRTTSGRGDFFPAASANDCFYLM